MRRRDKAGGKVKTQRTKALRRRNAPETARRRKSSAVNAAERIALLTRERDEALEQQTPDVGGAEGHLKFARRPFAGFSSNAAKCSCDFAELNSVISGYAREMLSA
jgi:hypothetical protein